MQFKHIVSNPQILGGNQLSKTQEFLFRLFWNGLHQALELMIH
jgi:hypothetical protein